MKILSSVFCIGLLASSVSFAQDTTLGAQNKAVPQELINVLLDLVDTEDTDVRVEAIESLESYEGTAHRKLVRIALDANETEAVRIAAFKVLSRSVHSDETPLFLRLARYGQLKNGDPKASMKLRQYILKSLWRAARTNLNNRKELQEIIFDPKTESLELRLSALWAFCEASQNSDAIQVLLDVATNPNIIDGNADDSELMRIEALKSLYRGMGSSYLYGNGRRKYTVRQWVKAVAEDEKAPMEVRKTALVLLHAARTQGFGNGVLVKTFLRDFAMSETNPSALRVAAVRAMELELDENLTRFFHLDHYGASFERNPLDE